MHHDATPPIPDIRPPIWVKPQIQGFQVQSRYNHRWAYVQPSVSQASRRTI